MTTPLSSNSVPLATPLSPSPALSSLLGHLETYCVYGCCGCEAFEFTAANAGPWLATAGGDAARAVLAEIETLRLAVHRASDPAVLYYTGDQVYGDDAGTLLDGAQAALTEALTAPRPTPVVSRG